MRLVVLLRHVLTFSCDLDSLCEVFVLTLDVSFMETSPSHQQMADNLKEKPVQVSMLDLCDVMALFLLWGTFWWHLVGAIWFQVDVFTADQYKVVLSDQLYPMMRSLS